MKRSFVQLSRAWYAATAIPNRGVVEEVMCQVVTDVGHKAEFAFRWHDLGSAAVARLEVFADSWWAFEFCPDLLNMLSEAESLRRPDPGRLVAALRACGFVDETPVASPDWGSAAGRELRERAIAKLLPEERAALNIPR